MSSMPTVTSQNKCISLPGWQAGAARGKVSDYLTHTHTCPHTVVWLWVEHWAY